jgi:hypothetical protein
MLGRPAPGARGNPERGDLTPGEAADIFNLVDRAARGLP